MTIEISDSEIAAIFDIMKSPIVEPVCLLNKGVQFEVQTMPVKFEGRVVYPLNGDSSEPLRLVTIHAT
jgi:hypothetical protein